MSKKEKEYTYFAFALAMFVSFMDGFDMQILGTCMRAFEINLGLPPSKLSVITSAQFMSLLVVTPLWGRLVDKFECGYIQCVAVLLCGLACVLHGLTSSYPMIVILTIINSAGLACTAPVDQKIITAMWSEKNGVYFGISWSCYCVGRLISSSIGASLVMKNIAGQYGWRIYCFIAGYIWILSSVLIHFFMKKKHNKNDQKPNSSSENGSKNGQTCDKKSKTKPRSFYTVPTFWLIVPVKYSSNAPIVILSYMVMYFQNSGLSDNLSGFAVGIVQVGSGVGGTGGGWVADKIHELESGYARIGLAIAALVVRVLCIMLLLWSPIEGGSLRWYHYAQLLIIGLSLFTIQGVDKAMLGNVVSKDDQATAISLVYLIAGIPSSTTLPTFVGYMAEKRFGYVVSTDKEVYVDPLAMQRNATALRKCMIYCMLIASTVNIVFYGGLMITYKEDADKMRKAEGDHKATTNTPNRETSNTVSCGDTTQSATPENEGTGGSGSSAASSDAQKQVSQAPANAQPHNTDSDAKEAGDSPRSESTSTQNLTQEQAPVPTKENTTDGSGSNDAKSLPTTPSSSEQRSSDKSSENSVTSTSDTDKSTSVESNANSKGDTSESVSTDKAMSGSAGVSQPAAAETPATPGQGSEAKPDQSTTDVSTASNSEETMKPSTDLQTTTSSHSAPIGITYVTCEGASVTSKSVDSETGASYVTCEGIAVSSKSMDSETGASHVSCDGVTVSSKYDYIAGARVACASAAASAAESGTTISTACAGVSLPYKSANKGVDAMNCTLAAAAAAEPGTIRATVCPITDIAVSRAEPTGSTASGVASISCASATDASKSGTVSTTACASVSLHKSGAGVGGSTALAASSSISSSGYPQSDDNHTPMVTANASGDMMYISVSNAGNGHNAEPNKAATDSKSVVSGNNDAGTGGDSQSTEQTGTTATFGKDNGNTQQSPTSSAGSKK